MLTAEEIRVVVAHGGGFVVSADSLTAEELKILAAHAKSSGANIVVKQARMLDAEQMRVIGAHGKAHVIFDLTE